MSPAPAPSTPSRNLPSRVSPRRSGRSKDKAPSSPPFNYVPLSPRLRPPVKPLRRRPVKSYLDRAATAACDESAGTVPSGTPAPPHPPSPTHPQFPPHLKPSWDRIENLRKLLAEARQSVHELEDAANVQLKVARGYAQRLEKELEENLLWAYGHHEAT